MQTIHRHLVAWMLGLALLVPATVNAENEVEPFILLGPYQIFLKSQNQIPTLDVELSGGESPINAPEGKNFLVLELEFKNTGEETFKQIQLTVNYKDDEGQPQSMAPYASQPKDSIKDKAPAPGKSVDGKLIFEIPVDSSEVALQAIGVKADDSLTPPVARPVMGKNY